MAGPDPAQAALSRAADLLRAAGAETDQVRRYGLCRLAAADSAWAAGAAAVGQRGTPRSPDPWTLLAVARPGLAEWVPVFAAAELRWASVRRGVRPGDREVDDLQRAATDFRALVAAGVRRAPVRPMAPLP